VTNSRITVDVKPGAKENRIERIGEGWYIVSVRAPRKKGKANVEIIKLLQKHFGGRARIVQGFRSTRKIVEIEKYACTKDNVENI